MQKAQSPTTVPFQAIAGGSRSCRIQLFNPQPDQEPARLQIHVLFTNPGDTRAALKTAVDMAAELEAEIALIVTQIVPFPLSLDTPPVPLDVASRQVVRLAESVNVELKGFIYLCRNPIETLVQNLPAHSLVVVGVRPRWPFGKAKRLARALRRHGHEVILAHHVKEISL